MVSQISMQKVYSGVLLRLTAVKGRERKETRLGRKKNQDALKFQQKPQWTSRELWRWVDTSELSRVTSRTFITPTSNQLLVVGCSRKGMWPYRGVRSLKEADSWGLFTGTTSSSWCNVPLLMGTAGGGGVERGKVQSQHPPKNH